MELWQGGAEGATAHDADKMHTGLRRKDWINPMWKQASAFPLLTYTSKPLCRP